MKLKDIKDLIRVVPDWPKPGISFKDITPVLKDSGAFKYVISRMAKPFMNGRSGKIDLVVSAESRGFILGAALAYKLKAGFVPLRKPGKLPWKTLKEEFELEYGKDAFEIHQDGAKHGDRVLIVDDVLATGGTMVAAVNLVRRLGGEVAGVALMIELKGLNGRSKVTSIGMDDGRIFSLMKL